MHCRILKVQDNLDENFIPINEEDYSDGFVGSVADYVQTIPEDEWFDEYNSLDDFYHFADGGKEVEDEDGGKHHLYTVTLFRTEIVKYFKDRKDAFISRIRKIEADARDDEEEILEFFDYPTKSALEDKFGDYFEWDGWQTETRFLHSVLNFMKHHGKTDITFRLEGVLDYHF